MAFGFPRPGCTEAHRGPGAGPAGRSAECGQGRRAGERHADEARGRAAGVPAQGGREVEGDAALPLLGAGQTGQVGDGTVGGEGKGRKEGVLLGLGFPCDPPAPTSAARGLRRSRPEAT